MFSLILNECLITHSNGKNRKKNNTLDSKLLYICVFKQGNNTISPAKSILVAAWQISPIYKIVLLWIDN